MATPKVAVLFVTIHSDEYDNADDLCVAVEAHLQQSDTFTVGEVSWERFEDRDEG